MNRARRWRTALLLLAGGVALAALLVSIHRAPETYPWGDPATTSISALRAARGDLAVGAYSRFGWNHPGPLLYELLAPLYALSGYREISLKWAALLLNLGAISGLLVVTWRRAPVLAVFIPFALGPLLYREPRLLFSAWNPLLPLLPLALTIGVATGVATGRVVLLPALAALLSLLVQSHVGFVPVALGIGIATLVLFVWHIRQAPSRPDRGLRRALLWTALVTGALWAVPLAHEVSTAPGNLAAIVRFFASTEHPAQAWSRTAAIFANQFVGPFAPTWEFTTMEASEVVSRVVLSVAMLELLLLGAVAFRSHYRGADYESAFASICLAVSIVGILAVRAIIGPVSDYLVIWIGVIGALSAAVIAAEAMSLLRIPVGLRSPMWRWALVSYVVLAGVLGGIRLTGKHAEDARSPFVRRLAGELDDYCRKAGITRPLFRFDFSIWPEATGVVLQFYKARREISVTDDMVYLVGTPFRRTGREVAEFYLMPTAETALPAGTVKHDWLTTLGPFRLVRLYR